MRIFVLRWVVLKPDIYQVTTFDSRKNNCIGPRLAILEGHVPRCGILALAKRSTLDTPEWPMD
jgi:hypothetical protein